MPGLLLVGFLAGAIAGISPCIVPVLPVVLVAGGNRIGPDAPSVGSRRRPVAIVLGLVVSFSFVVLVGSEVLSLLHLPQDFLRDAGIAALALVGVGFVVPWLGRLIERPFARLTARQPSGAAGGFVLGVTLGLLFVPCAGPVLAAITVVGTTHRVGIAAVLLTVAFGLGAAVPLLIVALAGNQLTRRVAALRRHRRVLQYVSGAVLIAIAAGIAFTAFAGLERDVPGYTSALQTRAEGSATIRKELGTLTGNGHSSLANCKPELATLEECGPAPAFAGITAWLNTPGGAPISLAKLRGKVVLVDFWTYSCINCQRALPHVEAWYKRYSPFGLVVVGVETPEFPFEHVVSNVRTAAAQLGVHYPIAIDDNDATWDAYDNEYWPADYLIDANGDVRHVSFGEGNYSTTERLIRELLVSADPKIELPPPTSVPNLTPTEPTNPETYVGYERLEYKFPTDEILANAPAEYQFPATLPIGGLGFSGEWTEHEWEATADRNAELELGFEAKDVYLVLGGSGTVSVSIDGRHTTTFVVGGIPRLYTLHKSKILSTGQMVLGFSPGVQAYDFTFG